MKNSQEINQSNLINVVTGDIIKLGNHILGCGTAQYKDLLDRMLGGNKINMVLTDPPYSCNYVDGKRTFSHLANITEIQNDHLQTDSEYLDFTKAWLETVKANISVPNSVYIFNTDKMALVIKQAIEQEGGKFSQLLVWVKSSSVIGRLDYNPQHELILYGWFGKHQFHKRKDKSVLCYPKPNRSSLHPTMKPIPLLRHLILNSTKLNDIIWDGFGGSGSTLIACEQVQRACVMTEISSKYCETIVNRFHRIFPELPIHKITV